MIHNFCSWYARKPIKGSKDSDDSLVSKNNMSKTIGSLDWRLRLDKVGQHSTCDAPPREPQNWKKKFQSKLDVLPNPQMVWTSL